MEIQRRQRRGLILAGVAAVAAASTTASGEALVLAGGNGAGAGGHYTYAGALAPLRGDLSDGVLGGLFIHRLDYRVDGVDGDTDTTQLGASALLGVRKRFGSDWAGLYGAIGREQTVERNTARSARDTWIGRVEAEAGREAGRWHFDARVNATPAVRGYWSRAVLLRDLGPFATGPELMLHGNVNYRATQAGLAVARVAGPGGTEFGFSFGYQSSAAEEGWYAGFGVAGHIR